MARSRPELVAALDLAGRKNSTEAVLYHGVLAALAGLGPSDLKALDLLVRFGPLTAGELSRRSGLAPASVTGLVSRLEEKGYVRRVPHPQDGRRVLVESLPEQLNAHAGVFDHFLALLHELYERYSDDELALLAGFLEAAADRQQTATAELRAGRA